VQRNFGCLEEFFLLKAFSPYENSETTFILECGCVKAIAVYIVVRALKIVFYEEKKKMFALKKKKLELHLFFS